MRTVHFTATTFTLRAVQSIFVNKKITVEYQTFNPPLTLYSPVSTYKFSLFVPKHYLYTWLTIDIIKEKLDAFSPMLLQNYSFSFFV